MLSVKKERYRLAILNILRRQTEPMTSVELTRALGQAGFDLSERTVRLYLEDLDESGLTRSHGRRGRTITDQGLEEARAAQAHGRVGYLSARIDQMAYRMTFDLTTRKGDVLVNLSVVRPQALVDCLDDVCQVFAQGLAMGDRVALLGPGESVGEVTVPEGRVGICTVCSITLNGVLLKHGVPTHSRFGGLLEIRDRQPTRFVEMIHYDGTSIDPLEVFIRSGMTNYHGAIREGNGLVGASYREIPEDSLDQVLQLASRLRTVGLGGFALIGSPGQSLLSLTPMEGRVGAVIIGGLNPVAILEERGQRVESRALAGLIDYSRLYTYHELQEHLQTHLRFRN